MNEERGKRGSKTNKEEWLQGYNKIYSPKAIREERRYV